MIYELPEKDYYKVEGLIKNSSHELSTKAVIRATSPGEIYVDDPNRPLSMLIKTSECNVVAGRADNKQFNLGIREKLDFFDPVTCDDEDWEHHIGEIHKNIALKKYVRRYYELDVLKYIDFRENLNSTYQLEYVNAYNLNKLDYENSDDVRDWIKLKDINSFQNHCLGSYVRIKNRIVSMSMVDCIVDNRVEIGVHTENDYKRKGLGSIAAAATVNSCLSKGIQKMGWHCVDTNIGSRMTAEKVGFVLVKKYDSYTPYPPIENDTDLTREEWNEWAQYYTEKNQIRPYYFWQAAQCYAKAANMMETIANIKCLIEAGQMGFVEYLPEIDAFKAFEGNKEWKELMSQINNAK